MDTGGPRSYTSTSDLNSRVGISPPNIWPRDYGVAAVLSLTQSSTCNAVVEMYGVFLQYNNGNYWWLRWEEGWYRLRRMGT